MEENKPKQFTLPNRDGAYMTLDIIEGDMYRINVDKEHEYCLHYSRVIYNGNMSGIEAFDPSGGPFLSIGYTLEGGYQIKEITFPSVGETVFRIEKG